MKATSPVDRLICSDTVLAASDRTLAEKYEQLHRSLSSDGYAVLRAGQLAWLTGRKECVGKENPRDQAVACLSSQYSDRTAFLTARYRSAGSLSIEARDATRRVPRLRVVESDTYPFVVGTPQARADAFNRYLAQRLNLAKGMFAASGIQLDAKPAGETTFRRTYEVHRFDDRLISLEILQFHESYFGHGWRSEYAINWDVQRGRPLRTADIFAPGQDWQQAIYDYALKQMREEGDIQDPANVFSSDSVDDDDAWLFDSDAALLLLGHGERSMVGASADVPIPYEVLRPFLRADAPFAVPIP